MAHRSELAKEPLRSSSQDAEPVLHHRASNISDISDFYNPYDESSRPPLHARESLVSLDSRASFYDENTSQRRDEAGHSYPATSSWAESFNYSSGGSYAPVSGSAAAPTRSASKGSRRLNFGKSIRKPAHETIEEEEYDLSLLGSAAPMSESIAAHPSHAAQSDAELNFDFTTVLGPTTAHDEHFIKQLQEQEAKGTLTGGLGQGFRPDTTVRDADLLQSPAITRSFSRSFSQRMTSIRNPSKTPSKGLARGTTLRTAGQDEANRRGEVIEVIMEEPEGVAADLSNMEGLSSYDTTNSRRSTIQAKAQTEVFYPQPNWKPFSMRWPYLAMLVLLSVALAGMTEFLFQKHRNNPVLIFKDPEEVDGGVYFTLKFGPTLIAVVFGVLWQFTDFEVRRLEAYYQMSRPGGALASESINVDYVTSFSFFRPFRALKVGHYAVALSSMGATLAISLVPTFAAASVILTPSREERLEDPMGEKKIYFSPVWARLLLSTLLICALAGCGLIYMLQSRRTGLLADVRGIAGLASMAVVSHILMDFKDLDTAKPKDIHNKLKNHRYLLKNSSLAPDDDNHVSSHERGKNEDYYLPDNPHPLMLRPAGSIPFLFALLIFTAFIPTFLFTPADVITDRASWVITALAVALKMTWGSMETAVRMMEPYYILSRRHAHSKTLTLDYTALPFLYMPGQALINRHWIMFLVGFGTVMAEWLTVLVTGLATVDGRQFLAFFRDDSASIINSGQETALSFALSLGLTVFILLYMFVVTALVFFRRRHPFLPRQPNTIASILAFIHQSKMLYNFVGTSKLTNAQMVQKLDDGQTYGLGWFVGRDGQTHCGVDVEELISNYKHGLDVSKQNEPWNMQWDVL